MRDTDPELTVQCLLAEYEALSEFQHHAKSSFLQYALTHNTALLAMLGWMADKFLTQGDQLGSVLRSHHPLMMAVLLVPILNSMFIMLCAYQLYSFFGIASYFQRIKQGLRDQGAFQALAYEDKFLDTREAGWSGALSMTLDVAGGAIWFAVPVMIGVSAVVSVPLLLPDMNRLEWLVYGISVAFTAAAIGYLVACVAYMRNVKAGRVRAEKKP